MLLRQTLQYFPAQFLGPVFQFVAILTWTHYLSPADLGVVALVTAVQELALAATLGWFSHYTLRYAAAFQGAAKSYLDTEAFVILLSGAMTMAIVLCLPRVVETEWTWPLVIAAVLQSVGRVAVSQLSDRSRTWGDPVSYSILQIGWPVGGFAVALLLVIFVQPTATAVLAGYALAQAAAVFATLLRIERGRAPQHFSRELMAKAATYAAPLVIGTVLIWVANNGIRFVVEWRDGAAAVGLVSVGWSVGLRIASVAAMVVTAAGFPLALARARDGGPDAGQAQLVRNGLLLAAVLAPASAGLWMIAGALVPLFVGAQFQEVTAAILPASILAGAARNFRIHCGEQIFLLHERPVVPLINDAVDAVAALLLGGFGLWYAGLPGLVAGAALGAVISLAVTMIWAWRAHGFAMPSRDMARIGVATLVMTCVLAALPTPAHALALTAVVAIGAAVFAAVMAWLYPAERRKAIALAGALFPRRNA